MIVLIGMLIGVWDPDAFIPTCALNAGMNPPGIMMEPHNQHAGKANGTAPGHGRIAGFIPWAVIMLSFESAVDSGSSNPRPPAFVYAIGPTTLVFCSLLAINGVLQYKKIGQWEESLYRELVYGILSPSAKSVLCRPIRIGTPAPAERGPLLSLFAQPQIRIVDSQPGPARDENNDERTA